MSTIKHPVGPQPASVYWRRRIVVGLGLIAVIVIIFLIVVRPGSGDRAGDAGTTPAGQSTPNPSGTDVAEPPVPQPCDPASISVAAVTDKTSYAEGEVPQISLTVTNEGAAACSFNAGSDVQEFRILSGAEQYWSSKDCQTDPVAQEALLQPNAPVSTVPIPWSRVRSTAGACDAEPTAVPAGGASYHLEVSINGVESADSKQFLLY